MSIDQINTISRSQFIRSAGMITTSVFLMPKEMFGQTSPVITIKNAAATAEITTHKLRGGISVLEGSGGNIAVFNGPDGKLMVDAGIGVSKKRIAAALAGISNEPLKYLINTHWHFDHTDGNEWVHNEGATIIAQEKTRKNLAATITVKDWEYTFRAAAKSALPSIVFKE